MERELMWVPWVSPGLEHVRLRVEEGGVGVDSLIVGLDGGYGFRVSYALRCDRYWRVQEVGVSVLSDGATLRLLSDGVGSWTAADRVPVPLLDGCLDVDLSATPLTNTLPIRRLGWKRGESVEMDMVYVAVPSLQLTVSRQRYTCLEELSLDGLFRFEELASGFSADLRVDRDGLVLDYPGFFRRVWPSRS